MDSKDEHGRTPLSWSAQKGRSEVVRLLLAAQADVDSKDANGTTVLSWAAMYGHSEVVQLLQGWKHMPRPKNESC